MFDLDCRDGGVVTIACRSRCGTKLRKSLRQQVTAKQASVTCASRVLPHALASGVILARFAPGETLEPKSPRRRDDLSNKKGARLVAGPLLVTGVPRGIRTPVTAVKGRCPRPLDDGDRKRQRPE